MVPLPGPTLLTTKDKGASAPLLEHPPRTGDGGFTLARA